MSSSGFIQGLTYCPAPAPVSATAVIFVNTADPNLATTFYDDPDDIPGSTDNVGFPQQSGYIYVGTDSSTWIWDGAQYITQSTPATTEWVFAGSNTDAGGNKTAGIARAGHISIADDKRGSASAAVYVRRVINGLTRTWYGLLAICNVAANSKSIYGISARLSPIGVIANLYGSDIRNTVAAGVTAASVTNSYAAATITGTVTGNVYGMFGLVSNNTGGAIGGSAFGCYNKIGSDSQIQNISGNVYGNYTLAYAVAAGSAIGGNLYGAYLQARSTGVAGVTYGHYQVDNGTPNVRNYFQSFTGINTPSPTANLSVNGTANKTGGGAWAVFSDARIKEGVAPYERGLAELERIRPVSFAYTNGYIDSLVGDVERAEGETHDEHIARKEQAILANRAAHSGRHVGIIAQEIMRVLPETVQVKETGFLPDQLQFDSNELVYLLINSVKELSSRVRALEGKVAA